MTGGGISLSLDILFFESRFPYGEVTFHRFKTLWMSVCEIFGFGSVFFDIEKKAVRFVIHQFPRVIEHRAAFAEIII